MITLLAVAAAGFAGAAVALAVSVPQRPALPGVDERASAVDVERRRLIRRLAARSDALPLRRRIVAGVALGLIAAVLGRQSGLAGSAGAGSASLAPALLGGIVGALTVLALGRLEPVSTRRRRQHLIMATPQALELLAACLEAGLPLRRGVEAVVEASDGPIVEVLDSILRLIELGMPEADAWRTLRGDPQLGAAAVDLARAADSGTMLVDALRRHASTARARRQSALQVRARAVGVRAVMPMMCCFMPAFLLIGVVPAVTSAIIHAFD